MRWRLYAPTYSFVKWGFDVYLLDTVVISELRKAKPDAGVVRWISKREDDQLFISVVTLGEIERGIEKQRKGNPQFADGLSTWLESLTSLYGNRVLPVTPEIARRWGRLSAALGNQSADLLIAATAIAHDLEVVTRNSSDFIPTGVSVVNPYTRKI